MFGRKRKLEEQILSTGVRTRAVVLDATQVSSHAAADPDPDGLRSTWTVYNVELKVTAEDGETFRTSVSARWWDNAGFLYEGMSVEVAYDPATRVVAIDAERGLAERRIQREQQLTAWADAAHELAASSGLPPAHAELTASAVSSNGHQRPDLLRSSGN